MNKNKVNHNKRQRRYGARDKEEKIKKIVELHNEGWSQVDIAKHLDIDRGTIHRWNQENPFFVPRTPGEAGKLKNKIYKYDENYFESIDTPNKAYIVGYIIGDGHISIRQTSKRIQMSLAEQDKQLLVDIAKELNVEELVTFRRKYKPNEQNKYTLTISSTKMCEDLIKLGVPGRDKTGNEEWITFNDESLQWAFLRGFFDADGHVQLRLRHDKYLRGRVGFTGNPKMLTDIHNFLKLYGIGINVNNLYHKQGCSDLRFGSRAELKKMFSYLYKDGSILLQRKYDIFSSINDIV